MSSLLAALLVAAAFAAGAPSSATNDFSLRMYDVLKTGSGNLIFSPYSLASALAMAEAGTAGPTREAVTRALGFAPGDDVEAGFRELRTALTGDSKAGSIYEEANALWPDKRFAMKSDFLARVEQAFGARPESLDFEGEAEASAERINAWCSEKTHKKIPSIVSAGDVKGTRLVLTNAVYFKGTWEDKFEKARTRSDDFQLDGGKRVKAPLMNIQKHFGYVETPSSQVLVLPYQGPFEMILVLPREQGGLGKIDLGGALNAGTRAFATEVKVFLPKFRLEDRHDLTRTIQRLGAGVLLGRPDLSRMTDEKNLAVSKALQKAMVDVNEEGTEAAAVTAMTVGMTAMVKPRPIPVFRADHPFAFVIRHKTTGAILFMGRVTNPNG